MVALKARFEEVPRSIGRSTFSSISMSCSQTLSASPDSGRHAIGAFVEDAEADIFEHRHAHREINRRAAHRQFHVGCLRSPRLIEVDRPG